MCNLENLKSVVVNGVRVYNMTLHDIKFDNGETSVIFPGNKNVSVRVIQDYAEVKNQFLPCETKQGEKKVIGLPNAQEGIAFIVSGVVLVASYLAMAIGMLLHKM